MKRQKLKYLFPALLILFSAIPFAYGAEGVSFITKNQLKKDLGNPNVAILDVRTHHDWTTSNWKVKGAVRRSPKNPAHWMNKYSKNQKIVLYCA